MLYKLDALKFFKKQKNCSIDLIFTDPPYALGSEIIIKKDGKPDYKKAVDFMNKWDAPTGEYWEKWFKEAFRILKYGGHLLMFGMDRQLLVFKYYSCLAGFIEKQSLYWFFASSFPKATDLSKIIDKHFKKKRKGEIDITVPATSLAQKYNGYKYGIAPLKQTNETILVFQKPYKTGSCLHDILTMEKNEEITCGALNIDGNKIGLDSGGWKGTPSKFRGLNGKKDIKNNIIGRYPAQTFIQCICNNAVKGKKTHMDPDCPCYKLDNQGKNNISKILQQCKYEQEDYDLYIYCPKVSKKEREQGCENLKSKSFHKISHNRRCKICGKQQISGSPCQCKNPEWEIITTERRFFNNHPAVKPIALCEKILKLFKAPHPQKILIPFCGSGSEIIGAMKAGFEKIEGCEINPEYIEIARARIKYWKKKIIDENALFINQKQNESSNT